MEWLAAGAILAVLAFLPLGVRFVYSDADMSIRLLVGPFSIALKKDKKEKTKKNKPAKAKPAPKTEEKKGGGLAEFKPYAQIAWDFLKELRLRIRVPVLQMHLILASGDPSDLAIDYGKTCAAIATIEPQLERFLKIKKKDLRVDCDFMADQTLVYVRVDVTITLGRVLVLAVRYGARALSAYLKNQNQSKGGKLS